MSDDLVEQVARGTLACGFGAAFVGMYGSYIAETLSATAQKPVTIDAGLAFVAVGLAGVVTSALAAWFGVTFSQGIRAADPQGPRGVRCWRGRRDRGQDLR